MHGAGDGNRTRIVSLEGMGLGAPSWLVNARSDGFRAFLMPHSRRGRPGERLHDVARPVAGGVPPRSRDATATALAMADTAGAWTYPQPGVRRRWPAARPR